MVNKKTARDQKTGAKAPVFFICQQICMLTGALLLATLGLNAQNLSKYYVSTSQPSGILYFVLPQTNFKNLELKKDFVMDVTYLNSNDSAVVNFTYIDREILNLITVSIAYGSWQYTSTASRIYVDAGKKQWNHRYTFKIPFNQLVLFYKAKEPVITITTDSLRSIPIHTVRQWGKNYPVNNRIMQVIQNNQI